MQWFTKLYCAANCSRCNFDSSFRNLSKFLQNYIIFIHTNLIFIAIDVRVIWSAKYNFVSRPTRLAVTLVCKTWSVPKIVPTPSIHKNRSLWKREFVTTVAVVVGRISPFFGGNKDLPEMVICFLHHYRVSMLRRNPWRLVSIKLFMSISSDIKKLWEPEVFPVTDGINQCLAKIVYKIQVVYCYWIKKNCCI